MIKSKKIGSTVRFRHDFDKINSKDYKDKYRLAENYFIRMRIFSFTDVVYSIIGRKDRTVQMEIDKYMEKAHSKDSKTSKKSTTSKESKDKISKVGYLKQRAKLSPYAIEDLYLGHNQEFYSPENEVFTYKGYLILATDGTKVNLPTTKENLELFGNASKPDAKPCAQLGMECVYDVCNHMILNTSIHRNDFDEIRAAEEQINHIHEVIGDRPFIVTQDRFYFSIPVVMRMIDNGIPFLIRLKSSSFRSEFKKLTEKEINDDDVEIKLTAARRAHYKGTEDEEIVKSRKSFPLRLVRVWNDKKTRCSTFATNLPRDMFPEEEIWNLYHMRWKIETAFQLLKDRLQMENFTGTKPVLVLQDIFSAIYVCNLAEDIARDAEIEKEKEFEAGNGHRYQWAINRTMDIAKLKDILISVLLEQNSKKQAAMMRKLYNEIMKYVVPIRTLPSLDRGNKLHVEKYSKNHKSTM